MFEKSDGISHMSPESSKRVRASKPSLSDLPVVHKGLVGCDHFDAEALATEGVLCSACSGAIHQSNILSSAAATFATGAVSKGDRQVELFEHLPSLGEVSVSAASGCHLCSILLNSFLHRVTNSSWEDLQFSSNLSLKDCMQKFPTTLEIRQGDTDEWPIDKNRAGPTFRIFLRVKGLVLREFSENKPCPSEPNIAGDSEIPPRKLEIALSSCTSSEGLFDAAAGWFTTCSQSHRFCQLKMYRGFGFLPSRLIHVGDAEDTSLKLVERAQVEYFSKVNEYSGRRPGYCTLSHCWGKQDSFKLTRANLSELKDGIPLKELPRTFQDAIEITRRVGFRFLWIDSLCILQDHKADWEKEAKTMGDIFIYSSLTIAALAATSDTEGCFSHRNALAQFPLTLKFKGDEQLTILPEGQLRRKGSGLNKTSDWREDGPLLRRGWVLQENILSPRTLYYGREGLYWECRESHASDFEPALVNDASEYDEQVTRRLRFKRRLNPLFDISNNPQFRLKRMSTIWMHIVELFTRCSLTYGKDRSFALLGVSDTLSRPCDVHFMYGLCKATLRPHLLWRAGKPCSRVSPHKPTWSWESIDGVVEYSNSMHFMLTEHTIVKGCFHPVQLDPSHVPPSDQEQLGCLALDVPLIPVSLEKIRNASAHLSYKVKLPDAYPWVGEAQVYFDVPFPDGQGLWWAYLGLWIAGNCSFKYEGKITNLKIIEQRGILVIPTRKENNEWERVGYMSLSIEGDKFARLKRVPKQKVYLW